MRARVCLFFSIFLIFPAAQGVELSLRARGNQNLGDFFFSNVASSSAAVTIKVNLSCFAADLRNVANPLSPTGTVKMNFGIGPNSKRILKNGTGDFALLFPAWMATKRVTNTNPSFSRDDVVNLNHPDLRGGTAYGIQNTIIIRPAGIINSGIQLDPSQQTGTFYTRLESLNALQYISFDQDIQAQGRCYAEQADPKSPKKPTSMPGWLEFLRPLETLAGGYMPGRDDAVNDPVTPQDRGYGQPSCKGPLQGWNIDASAAAGIIDFTQAAALKVAYKEFMGHDGPLTGEWTAAWSSDFKTLNVNAAFPGDFTMCGSFYSPLMLFFDDSRPTFKARSGFKVHPMAVGTYWPEKTSKAYILSLDLNENGSIDDWREIFGEESNRTNGFEKLSDYDVNRDGVIDSRDPVFRKLKLWRDRTETGRSRPEDLFTLKQMGITSISLKYKYDYQIAIADRARLRETSTFEFEKNGRKKRGAIIDVWLSN